MNYEKKAEELAWILWSHAVDPLRSIINFEGANYDFVDKAKAILVVALDEESNYSDEDGWIEDQCTSITD